MRSFYCKDKSSLIIVDIASSCSGRSCGSCLTMFPVSNLHFLYHSFFFYVLGVIENGISILGHAGNIGWSTFYPEIQVIIDFHFYGLIHRKG